MSVLRIQDNIQQSDGTELVNESESRSVMSDSL